jgi:dTDP-4-dehydrorhamnose reductase
MRILVTGGTGQLGSEWVDYLNRKGVEFIALPASDFDVTDHEDTRRVMSNLNPNLIINCAAYTNVDQAEDESEKAFLINRDGVKNLAEYCASKDIKLVHFSTDYIFPGNREDEETYPQGYSEEATKQPINVYGESKLAGEEALENSGCDYILIRTSWLCGKHGSNFVKTMLKLAQNHEEPKVVDDQIGSPTFTQNLVANGWNLIEKKRSGVFHISSIGKITWYEFAQEIFNQAGIDITIEPVSSSEFKSKAERPAFSLLSNQKIGNIPDSEIIGWKDGLSSLLKELMV